MKVLFFFVIFSALSPLLIAQVPNFLWAQTPPLVGTEHGKSVATDGDGNIFVTGAFEDSVSFGATTLISQGGYDVFIAKYNPSGSVMWAVSAGGTENDYGNGISTDSNGNVFFCGDFSSHEMIMDSFILINASQSIFTDIFIGGYDPSGNILWASSFGGNGFDYANDITTDSFGNVLLTGAMFGSEITVGSDSLISNAFGMFVAKFNQSGYPIWARTAGESSYDEGLGISCDQSGNIFVAGRFTTTITFDSVTLNNSGNTSYSDLFLVKYTPSGNVIWVRTADGQTVDLAYDVDIDPDGNAVMTGSFSSGTLTIDSVILVNSNPGYADIFVAKYDNAGDLLWARSAGGISDDHGLSTSIDLIGNIYITGFFASSTCNFGQTSLTKSNESVFNFYLVKYDTNGYVIWAKSAEETGNSKGNSVATDLFGNLFVTGYFSGPTINFDSHILLNDTNSVSMFVTKIGSQHYIFIDSPNKHQIYSVFPNPTHNYLNFFAEKSFIGNNYSIYNSSGKVVLHGNISSENMKIDLEKLNQGVHYLIYQGNIDKPVKFIKN